MEYLVKKILIAKAKLFFSIILNFNSVKINLHKHLFYL